MSPSPFVVEWLPRARRAADRGGVPGARRLALDIATGRGRHARALTREGFRTLAVDIDLDAARDAMRAAAADGAPFAAWCADLTRYPLPSERFDLIVVTRYLQRDLFASIAGALVPGGLLLYETFTTAQLAHATGPRSPDHLLEPGELRRAFDGLEVLFYEEVLAPEAVARLAARRPARAASRS
jgi:tellurite methyltransferase